MSAEVATYRFSVGEFNKLGEAGIFDEDDRVELSDGEIIVTRPIGTRHADNTLVYDRERKPHKYAQSGLAEVWIVNVSNQTIELRVPAGSAYSSSVRFRRDQKITIAAFPDVPFVVEELIG